MRLHLAAAAALLAPAALAQTTLHVDADLTTGANDGSSWADAFQGEGGLQNALAAATAGDGIWVAEGTYVPSATGARGVSFVPKSDVEVYGGFAGGEAALHERPARGVAPSVLSGDLLGNDDGTPAGRADNSFNVVDALGANQTALLDGFTITAGNATSGSSDRGGGLLCQGGWRPRFVGCDFVANRCSFGGGAVYINGGGAPSFVECRFEDNVGGSFGGAFDIAGGGNVFFDRCWFEGNSAQRAGALEVFATGRITVLNSVFVGNTSTGTGGGGAMWFGSGGSSDVVNCTVFGNTATANAWGGIRAQSASPQVRNTIVFGNTGTSGSGEVSPGASVQHCIVEGGFAGAGNLDLDPQLVDPLGGDVTFGAGSPAVDAGDGDALLAGMDVDLVGGRRAWDAPGVANTGAGVPPFVDIGAYEYTTALGRYSCPAVSNSTGQRGRITATGSAVASANDVTLTAEALPPGQFGIFVVSRFEGLTPAAGGVGTLCLAGPIGRYNGPGQILPVGPTGTFELALDLNAIPQATGFASAAPGDTWRFQAWHRDTILFQQTSNFTDAVAITFE